MKKLFIIIAVLFCTVAKSQAIDTITNAIQIHPAVVNALKKDTVFQVTWSLFGINRKDTSGANSYVQLFDRKSNRIDEQNIPIPFSVLRSLTFWTMVGVIDDYILTFLGLQKK